MCYINNLPLEKIKIEISISWCVEKYNLHTNHAPYTENQGNFNWQRNFHHHWYLMNLPKLCCVCVFTQGWLCGRPGGGVWTSREIRAAVMPSRWLETAGGQISAKSNQHLRSQSRLTWSSIQHEKVICGDGSLQVWKKLLPLLSCCHHCFQTAKANNKRQFTMRAGRYQQATELIFLLWKLSINYITTRCVASSEWGSHPWLRVEAFNKVKRWGDSKWGRRHWRLFTALLRRGQLVLLK